MKQDIQSSREIAEATERLVEALRISQNASDMMDEAFAALLGVNRTDARCLDIVQRRGRVTAGELAREAGLTSGAVTVIVDRLERAGYLLRHRDDRDRRKVFIETTPLTEDLSAEVFGQNSRIGMKTLSTLQVEDMRLVTRFLRINALMNQTLAESLRGVCAREADASDPFRVAQQYAADIRMRTEALEKGIATILETEKP